MSAESNSFNQRQMFNASTAFIEHATLAGLSTYQALRQEAEQQPEAFWARLALSCLDWYRPFTKVLDQTNAPFYQWFDDGLINVSHNCLDRHIKQGLGKKTAIVFEADDGQVATIDYQTLHQRVCKLANGLKAQGVKKGDRVIIYVGMSIEGAIAMLACTRIGAIHSVVFAGFSAKSLHERMLDTGAVAVITADAQWRGGKLLALKAIVDEALALGQTDQIKHVIVYQRAKIDVTWHAQRDIWLHKLEAFMPDECLPEWVEAEHPLFILYTSGSTGKPKGIQHSTAGYLLWSIVTMQWVFDIKPNDLFWCTADIGWITGHTYTVYGPLATGTTVFIFEGTPTYPDGGRFWQIIERHKISILYTAPTAIRSLIKIADSQKDLHPSQYNLASLRLLGSVGEPINPAAWLWYYRYVGGERCPIVDTFWQTETGGHMIAPLPGAIPMVPGSCTLPLPGIEAAVVDEFGNDVPTGQGGLLVIKQPWPAMVRTIWNNPERFRHAYFPEELGGKYYLAGDGAIRDPETGYFTITGRIDDVLNVSGHRLGTMEIESALVAHPLVAEAAVVGRADEITGEAIVAFVVLKRVAPTSHEEAEHIANELRVWVNKEIGPIAKPHELRFGDNLPKTRSGKIMRRLLRTLAMGAEITQDISTLDNPAILEQLKQAR